MNISEAYDTRVAYPLIIVAVLSLLFVDANGHKVLPLKNASNSSSSNSKSVINKQPDTTITSAPILPTLSKTVKTEDLAPGESPLDIQTSSPQNSSASDTASPSSGSQLQNTPASSNSSNQPSVTDTENLINGLTNDIIQVPKTVTNDVQTTINHQ